MPNSPVSNPYISAWQTIIKQPNMTIKTFDFQIGMVDSPSEQSVVWTLDRDHILVKIEPLLNPNYFGLSPATYLKLYLKVNPPNGNQFIIWSAEIKESVWSATTRIPWTQLSTKRYGVYLPKGTVLTFSNQWLPQSSFCNNRVKIWVREL